jgi:hypothetical protein
MASLAELRHGPPVGHGGRDTEDRDTEDRDTDDQAVTERT